MSVTVSDTYFMQHALSLADVPQESPSPNPRVGAVLVRDGTIVASGFHTGPGFEHAEEMAIRAAGDAAHGTTLYCTLEPCSHSGHGKHRPPCAPLIARSGVRRVVIAQLDPNPRVKGNGREILERAGIEVIVGVAFDDAIAQNAGFNTWMAIGRPFVHIKVAQSLDGRLAALDGSSAWITGTDAREQSHRGRGECDAVVVGIGTVLADDPLLTVRHGAPRRPSAVVFDSRARLPGSSRLVRERARETIVVVAPAAPCERVAALEREGVTVVRTEGSEDSIDLPEALEALGSFGIRSLYVEGGKNLIQAFLQADLYDRISAYIAPVLLGGPGIALEPPAATSMDDAVRLERARCKTIGSQAYLTGYRPGWWARIREAMEEVCNVYGAY